MNLNRRLSFSPFLSVALDWPAFIKAHPVMEPGDMLPSQVTAKGFSTLRYVGAVLVVEVVTYTKEVDEETVRRIAQQRWEALVANDIPAAHQEVWDQTHAECLAKATPTRKAVSLLIDEVSFEETVRDGRVDATVTILATGRAADDTESTIREWMRNFIDLGDIVDGQAPRLISRYAAARERVKGTSPMPVLWAWKNIPQGASCRVGAYVLEVIGPVKVKGSEVKASITGAVALNAANQLEEKMGAVPMDLWLRSTRDNNCDHHLTPEGIDRSVILTAAKDWRGLEAESKVVIVLQVVDDAVGVYEALLELSGEQADVSPS